MRSTFSIVMNTIKMQKRRFCSKLLRHMTAKLQRSNMRSLVILNLSVATAAWLSWWTTLAWRKENRYMKWAGVGLAGLSAAAISLVSVLAAAGLYKMHTRNAPVPDLNVAGTPEQIQRGQVILDSFCGTCPSRTSPFAGNSWWAEFSRSLSARLYRPILPNLTH